MIVIIVRKENSMTTQQKFVPFSESKTKEERVAYVKANPARYMPLPLKNKLDELDKKMDLILSKLPK